MEILRRENRISNVGVALSITIIAVAAVVLHYMQTMQAMIELRDEFLRSRQSDL